MRRAIAAVLACLAPSCADPPTFHLPLSTQFPVDDVRLGMTFDDLRRARSEIMVVALAEELDVEPRCSSIEYGRLNWRRATFRGEGEAVAGAVDVVGVTIGDPGPGEAELVTRAWLTEFVSPISPLLHAPALARSRLLDAPRHGALQRPAQVRA